MLVSRVGNRVLEMKIDSSKKGLFNRYSFQSRQSICDFERGANNLKIDRLGLCSLTYGQRLLGPGLCVFLNSTQAAFYDFGHRWAVLTLGTCHQALPISGRTHRTPWRCARRSRARSFDATRFIGTLPLSGCCPPRYARGC